MRTCVGAWEPATLLLLGLVLGARAVLNCVGNTYPNGHRCCQECQPEDLAWPKKGGTGLCSPEERPAACPQAGLGQPANVPSSAAGSGMVSRCEGPRDTVCLPCGPDSYNEAVNYEACKPCTQCNQTWAGPASSTAPPAPPGSGSELKKKCTPTQDTVCSCRPGTQPLGGFKHGVDCAPCPPGYFSPGDNKACRPWTKSPAGCCPGPGLKPPGPSGCPTGPAPAQKGLEATRCPQASRFRTPIQEEQADAHSTLAKI
ncbi:tumor necrosis factor receptor superfamily member 4 isoform X18 [Sciurus carolinensis]|uniref:tumor necrosis factor receptor superfamily member 4 isoform X18 n=1 Tax=Sciurus carolinensis TaxID=30640 RepID=UPI001FB3DC82|nr:tumor necrosis factor receptor superfamily member 4 isoform X18 [Sciurus carolinensis]